MCGVRTFELSLPLNYLYLCTIRIVKEVFIVWALSGALS